MNPPATVDIGTSRYVVRYIKGLTDADGAAMDGLCHVRERLIELEDSVAENYKKETFTHEVLHGLFDRVHFRELFLDEDEDQEEPAVSLMAPLLLDWLRQNPQAVRWLSATP